MSELTFIGSSELAKLTGIPWEHLEKTKHLTADERRRYHQWLLENVGQVFTWTGIRPDHLRVVLQLRNETSVANFDLNDMAHDLESWKKLTDEDGGPQAKLTRLRNALRVADEIISDSILHADGQDLLGQALIHFAPPGEKLADWMIGVYELRDVADAACAHQGSGGPPRLPDWLPCVIGYLQFQNYSWENFKALMWVLGYRKNDGMSHWAEIKKQAKGPEWNLPWDLMPRYAAWCRFVRYKEQKAKRTDQSNGQRTP